MRALLRISQNRHVAKLTGSESNLPKEICFMSPRRRGHIHRHTGLMQRLREGSMCFQL